MPSSFSFFKSSSNSERRTSTASIDSSRSANSKRSPSLSASAGTTSSIPEGATDTTFSSDRVGGNQQSDLHAHLRQKLPALSTGYAAAAAANQSPQDPARSDSVPSIGITSPSSDQPKPLWNPNDSDFSPRLISTSFGQSGDDNADTAAFLPSQRRTSSFAVSSSDDEEDRLFSVASSAKTAARSTKMPKSSSTHSKSRSENGAKKSDRHDVMRRAMAEATSSDAFGLSSADNGAEDAFNSRHHLETSDSVGSVPGQSQPKIGEGSLSFDHFGTTVSGAGGGDNDEVVHAEGPTKAAARSSITPSESQDSQNGKAFPKRPGMGSRASSFKSENGQDAHMYSESPADTVFSNSTPLRSSTSTTGIVPGQTASSRASSLSVPHSAPANDTKGGSKQMHESASTSKLLHSPMQRLRKLSDSGSSHSGPKPTAGIAGAIAASSMAGMGVGHKAMLEQSQASLPLAKAKSRSRNSSIGAEYISGYQGGMYRDAKTGKMIERGPDQDDEDGLARRIKFARDRSATASTHSLASSDFSVASGLNAAANFSPTSVAHLGLLAPEDVARRTNEGAPPLTPGGIGAVGGLSPSGLGERVALGEDEPWPGDVGTQITGFAVASSKRNADFHNLFTSVPEDDYLIEDYGCALVREILIQGRLYVSENHVCFYANIFGWVTNIVLPFSEIVSTEKRMTAYVIPNAIQIATLHSKQTFASFLSRDTTYDLIVNIWKLSHPGVPTSEAAAEALTDEDSVIEHDTAKDGDGDGDKNKSDAGHDEAAPKKSKRNKLKKKLGIKDDEKNSTTDDKHAQNGSAIGRGKSPGPGGKKGPHRKTSCPCEKDKKHYSTIALDTTYPAVPEKIYNLIFTSGFMKEFWTDNQNLLDLQMSDWAPNAQSDNMLTRNISYIKPLTGSFGPKQTKCLLADENIHVDFDDYVVALTTTRTPDVPSGGSFSVKTRTCFTWAGGNVTKVFVTCQVEWTGRSMVKGIIDRASIDGQKQYYKDLDVAIRKYIKEHSSEFREEGDEDADVEKAIEGNAEAGIESSEAKSKEASSGASDGGAEGKEGLAKYLDMASNGASTVFETVSDGVGMLSDMTGGISPSVLILGFVVFLLVISNLWAMRSPSGRDPLDPHRLRTNTQQGLRGGKSSHKGASHHSETEAAQAVAIAVREVLQDYFEPSSRNLMASARVGSAGGKNAFSVQSDDPLQEIQDLLSLLDTVEQRVGVLRDQIKSSSVGQSSVDAPTSKGKKDK